MARGLLTGVPLRKGSIPLAAPIKLVGWREGKTYDGNLVEVFTFAVGFLVHVKLAAAWRVPATLATAIRK